MNAETRIRECLTYLYEPAQVEVLWPQIQNRLENFRTQNPELGDKSGELSQRDAILITYGDQICEPGQPHLQTLTEFLEIHLGDAVSGIHILPFSPYSSDDGFSVIDYRQVDTHLGTWDMISRLGLRYRMMFDAVINHISRESDWFQGFVSGESPYIDYFITVDPDTDLSTVVRPRALPLLTPVKASHGTAHVWTTFSDDQIDLNYANPLVLLEILDLLLFYVEQSAEIIRLDAIAYLWKEIGTTCIHLPQTHRVVKLFRAVLDAVAPGIILITETNVPHNENISYFGEPLPELETGSAYQRGDEAQLVYQFPLAPLILHTFYTSNSTTLTEWAAALKVPFNSVTFFNFIASHDGIGVRPAEGILNVDEIQAIVDLTLAHGGLVSYKTDADGSKSVYELNITLYDALNNPSDPQLYLDVRRFLASQTIMLSLAGVPGIYIHSLFGSHNCHTCVEQTGRARSMNRQKFKRSSLESALADPASIQSQVFLGYKHLLQVRQTSPAFHPSGQQQVLSIHDRIFAVIRSAPHGTHDVLCLINVSHEEQGLALDINALHLPLETTWSDLIGDKKYYLKTGHLTLTLEGYQALWLTPQISSG